MLKNSATNLHRISFLGYCSKPLEILGVDLIDAEIRKEEALHFFSLPERQREFFPIVTMRDLRTTKRFEIIIIAKAWSFEFKMMFFYNKDNHTVSLDCVKMDEIKAVDRVSNFMSSIKSFEPFARTVIQGSMAIIILEGIKRVLSG